MPEESIPSKELPNDFNGEQTQAQTRNLLRKMDMRILPVSALIYLLNSMDRSNVGNAKVMNQEEGHDLLTSTGLSQMQYKITLMAFAIAYGIFEVPSNYLIKRLRPSRWIAFLMVCWGMITMAMGGVKDFASLAVVRFLLGTFEAGFFPGLSFCLTFWYRPEERSVRIAFIYASAALASAFGGLVAFGVAHMDGVGGLVAWRWLFILEGLPSVLLSVVIWNIFPDFPETAQWLNEDERIIAVARLGPSSGSKSTNKDLSWEIVKETLMDWRLWIHYFAYFGVSLTFGSLSLFTPTIIKGLGYTSLHAQILAAPPYAIAYVVTIPVAYCADAWNRRGLVAGVCSLVGASGFILSACLAPDAYKQRYGALIIAASGCYASVPPLIGWVSSNVHPAVTGMVVAMNVSFGAYGQIVGVWIYKNEEESRGFPTGHWVNAGALLSVGVACGVLHGIYWRRNRRKDVGGEDCEVRVEEWKL